MENIESLNPLSFTPRSEVRKGKHRASYQREDVYQLIDDTKLGHMAFIEDGHPVVIPMTFWRKDDHLYFHSLNKSRLMKMIQAGKEVCISFAQATEWVLSKSAFHTSVNYRSAVLYCSGEVVTDEAEFDEIFKGLFDQIEMGRWEQVRSPNKKERKATALLKLNIDEGAFKSRSGGPNEEPEDLLLPVKSGTRAIGGCPFHNGVDNS